MKKIKLLTVFIAATALSAPAFSIAQLGVQGNYQNVTYKTSASSDAYSGFGFGVIGRFTAGIPLLITFAAGPFMDFATLTKTNAGDISQLRVGAEIALYADVVGNVIGLTPYVRFGYGYENNSAKATTTTVASSYSGSGGHTIFGLTLKVVPLIYVFAEGGAQWSTVSATGGSDISTSGWRASLGAMVWL